MTGRFSRLRLRRRSLASFALCLLLAGCADFAIVVTTPAPPTPVALSLPPIGFNHRYGNTPVAAADGLVIERQLFAQMAYWEVAIHTDPVQSGYVKVGDKAAAKSARHAVTHILMVIATELRGTIAGLIAFPTNAGQQMYCEALLDRVRQDGYDAFTSAELLVFFTESDQHAKLTWTLSGGYTFAVYDNNLRGTAFSPGGSQTPLPLPPSAPASP